MCSASISSSRMVTLSDFSFRFVACRSCDFGPPGQHLSLQEWRPQFIVVPQTRKHIGGSATPCGHIVLNVFLPQRHFKSTFSKHGGHDPAWHAAVQLCPHARAFPQGFSQCGMESWHDVRGFSLEAVISVNGVLPQGQWVMISAENGQWGISPRCG